MALQRQVVLRGLQGIRAEFEDRTWLAFWRVVVDGQPAPDVAQELLMTPGAVRVAKCRVLNRLRRELGDLAP
jgi:RNA polymerase sigma-70 factor (ECF subfamily)